MILRHTQRLHSNEPRNESRRAWVGWSGVINRRRRQGADQAQPQTRTTQPTQHQRNASTRRHPPPTLVMHCDIQESTKQPNNIPNPQPPSQPPLTTSTQLHSKADHHLNHHLTSTQVPSLAEMADVAAATGKVLILLNPSLADRPSSGGVMGVRGRQARIDFAQSFCESLSCGRERQSPSARAFRAGGSAKVLLRGPSVRVGAPRADLSAARPPHPPHTTTR
jgi:hypothetical protein